MMNNVRKMGTELKCLNFIIMVRIKVRAPKHIVRVLFEVRVKKEKV